MFFDDWTGIWRTLLVGALAYAALIALVRVAGKRTLAKMNAFDFVVTVALGSTLATTILSEDVSLARGVLALALLVGLQFVITWSSVRVGSIRAVVTGEPALLLHRGVVLPGALRRERVTETEVRAAVRTAGIASVDDVEAVVLETDGSFSVVRREKPEHAASSLRDVAGVPRDDGSATAGG
jgi:uncharacterized membrane protein YcaP (DUF421 family)